MGLAKADALLYFLLFSISYGPEFDETVGNYAKSASLDHLVPLLNHATEIWGPPPTK